MESYISFVMMTVMGLILTIGLWIGTILLRKARTGADWWLMLSGLIAGTLGVIFYGVMMALMIESFRRGRPSGSYPRSTAAYAISGGVSGIFIFCSAILFNVGFVLNSLAVVRLAKRAAELEGICAAMGAELQQTRSLTGL